MGVVDVQRTTAGALLVLARQERDISQRELAELAGVAQSEIAKIESHTFPNGCHMAEVEIDPETGIVQIVRYTGVYDFGTIVNPMLVAGLLHDQVLLARRRNIEEDHAAGDSLLKLDVLLQFNIRPEIDELNAPVWRADAVEAPEALDDADGVPMDVVINQKIAVLKVLTLADAIRGDEEVNISLDGEVGGALLRARRKGCQYAGEVFAKLG